MTPPTWTRVAVGEHYTHPAYPQAVVSSFCRHDPREPRSRSGWVAVVNFSELGEFATREIAQHYVEAYLS